MEETKTNNVANTLPDEATSTPQEVNVVPNPTVEELQKQVADLTRLVEATADKGRLLNYQSTKEGRKPTKINLSKFQGGIITGWRTIKDQLVKHPTTGATVGEEQEYEVVVQKADGTVAKHSLGSYSAFSDARYTDRVEAEVVGRKEDYEGNITFDIVTDEGTKLSIDSRFVN